MCVCVCVCACVCCMCCACILACSQCGPEMSLEHESGGRALEAAGPAGSQCALPSRQSFIRKVCSREYMYATCMSLFTYRNSSYYFDSMGSLDQICASASTWPMSIPTHTYTLIRKNNKLILKHSIHTCTCEHTHTHTHTPDGLAARGRL